MRIVKTSSSILRKFLIFNFFAFLILGLFTFIYLKGIQPNLVKQRTEKHVVIIDNTSNHIERLQLTFEKESIKNFLLSTRFLFQNLERVQFYNLNGNLIADTNVLDLDQTVFTKTDLVLEETIENNSSLQKTQQKSQEKKKDGEIQTIKKLIVNKKNENPSFFEINEGNNFYVKTLSGVIVNSETLGYIMVTEQANEIITAVAERKNFILRTVLAIAFVIFIFSLFLNRYILKPIAGLVAYT